MGIDTVNDIEPRVQYVASAGQTAFDYPFPIFADGDIVVATAPDEDTEATILTLTTDYTVTGEGNDNGGTVTLVVGVAAGTIVTLYRDLPAERLTDVAQNGPWTSQNYNDELDKIIMLIQQLKMQLDRAVQVSVTSTTDPDDINFDDIADLAGSLTTLDSLQDVNASAPAENDVLVFDADTNTWIATAPSLIQTDEADNVIDIRGAMFVGIAGNVVTVPVNDVPIVIKQACNITKVTVLTRDGTGSCEIDIWKRSYNSYPPTVAQSITNGAPITITNSNKTQLTTAQLDTAGWTRSLSQDDTLLIHLDSTSVFEVIGVFIELTPVGTLPVDDVTDQRIEDIANAAIDERNIPGLETAGSVYTLTLGSGFFQDLNLFKLLGSPAGAVTANLVVPAGTTINASSTRTYGIDTSGFASGSTINLTINGDVDGCGGDGGDGGSICIDHTGDDIGFRAAARVGKAGGNAIKGPGSGRTLNILGAGRVRGGGGGGAGGGGSCHNKSGLQAGGGGGGGGAGGGRPGRGGNLNIREAETATAADGQEGSRGSDGTYGTAGAGAQSGGQALGGAGGAGGDWGTAGAAGTYPTLYDWDITARAGGAAGKAIDVNSGTVVTAAFTGTISGAVS